MLRQADEPELELDDVLHPEGWERREIDDANVVPEGNEYISDDEDTTDDEWVGDCFDGQPE